MRKQVQGDRAIPGAWAHCSPSVATGYFSSHSVAEILKLMHARRNSWVALYPGRVALGTRLTPGLPRHIFCDATTDFMNECIAKAD